MKKDIQMERKRPKMFLKQVDTKSKVCRIRKMGAARQKKLCALWIIEFVNYKSACTRHMVEVMKGLSGQKGTVLCPGFYNH